MTIFGAAPLVLVGLVMLLGMILGVGLLARRQLGSAVALGCGLLAVGVGLFSLMVIFGLSVAYVSLHSPPPKPSALPPVPERPFPIDVQSSHDRIDLQTEHDRAGGERAGGRSAGRDGQPAPSSLSRPADQSLSLPSPAEQSLVVSQGAPPPTEPVGQQQDQPAYGPRVETPDVTEPGGRQQGQPATPTQGDANPNARGTDTQESPPVGESGAIVESGSTANTESKAPGEGLNAESADLISRAMAKGIKAALDFLAREGALENNNTQQPAHAATASSQPAIAGGKQDEREASPSAGASAAGASGGATNTPANNSAPSAAGGSIKPDSSRRRPAWVDAPPERTSDGHRMTLKVGPCFSAEECRRSLPEELEKAAKQYARQYLQLDFPGGIGIDPEVLQTTLVRATWEETIVTSVGPTAWLHALVEFDRRAGGLFKEAYRRTVIESRLKSAGAIVGCTLLLLGVVYTGLRADERLAGRFRLLTVAACLLAVGAVSAGAVGLLRQIAHGG
jgi:hypothetical protein